ncbi:MAG: hypothetical protein ACD_15C00005G0004 [uncultured bacterium]|nr:MAG: hypothetical protein ACD_15C00005G0004 [uncultured bacterium]
MSKEKFLSDAKAHIEKTCSHITKSLQETLTAIKRSEEIYLSLPEFDRPVEKQVQNYHKKRLAELSHLEKSPYFVRCDVVFDEESKPHTFYFGKFNFNQDSIYSWVTPASAIRFENPGKVSYFLPSGKQQNALLLRKDQYMIVEGRIKFLSSESTEYPRKLIFQEHFSVLKSSFALPEIVAQMEKLQDQVIRAHHVGSFLISGPAGSGKTTLALHRVAYMNQSPDLAEKYPSQSIVVFVQDNGTKEYFSQLLPGLGINDIFITTFSEWAMSILKLKSGYAPRFIFHEESEENLDLFEFSKLQALKKHRLKNDSGFSLLKKIYAPFFSDKQKEIFQKQMESDTLDRIDLTILLKSFYQKNRKLEIVSEYLIENKFGKIETKKAAKKMSYNLAVIDEFQNYLPEQLRLIKKCLEEKNQSVIYVGDMTQKVQLGTISGWDAIEENIHDKRQVVLHKVYRNTKNILQFIASLGYDIEIPTNIKDGSPVSEKIFVSPQDEIDYIQKTLAQKTFQSVGVLAKNSFYVDKFRKRLTDKKIHCMTINEAQGVEFDIVFLVGIHPKLFSLNFPQDTPLDLIQEKKKINRDLLYVALTRAISELHISGKENLRNVIQLSAIDKHI